MKSRPARIATPARQSPDGSSRMADGQSVAGGEKTKEQLKEDLRNTREELAIQKWGLEKTLGGMKVLVKEAGEAKAVDDAIIASIGDGLVVVDKMGKILTVNNAFENLVGWKEKEVLGKLLVEVVPREDEAGNIVPFKERILTKILSTTTDTYYTRKDGSRFPVAITATKIILNGKRVGAIEVFRDITRETEVDKAKSEFTSIASHELRTPLTAIDGLVSMILDGEYGEVNKELMQPLSDVNTSSERLIHLVNDLLNLSRLQAGKLKYTLSETDIKPIVEGVVKMLQVIAEPKGLRLSAPNIDSVTVLVDVNKMEQILDNLIGNSLKFTDKGSIVLSTKITENNVIIFITDTGIGIGKEDLGKLFGRFEKLESGLGRAAGTGLGLHISREMARKMGGDVWLEKSEKGVGSTFALSLPKSKTPLAEKIKKPVDLIIKN